MNFMNISENQKIDFMKKAAFIANSSSCNYKIGAVGVQYKNRDGVGLDFLSTLKNPNIKTKDDLIYIKSWNETLPGELYCQEIGSDGCKKCIRADENLKLKEFDKVCSSHAEITLISRCAKHGISTNKMILFITNSPCYVCAKALIQSGFEEVYYMAMHTDMRGIELLKKNGIKCELLDQIF